MFVVACGGGGSGGGGGGPPPSSLLYTDVTATHLPVAIINRRCMDVVPADFDNDGDRDLVLAIESGANVLLRNDGTGRFTDVSAAGGFTIHGDHEDLAVGDLDGDGDLDVAVAAEDTQVHEVYRNDGALVFNAQQLATGSTANAVVMVDADDDGDGDLLFGNNGTELLQMNQGAMVFTVDAMGRAPQTALVTQDVALGDIDGDGDIDAILANEGAEETWIRAAGAWTLDMTRVTDGGNDESRRAILADFDADGDLDLFVGNVVQEVPGSQMVDKLYLNDGTGHFTVTAGRLPSGWRSYGGTAADVDADGDLDLVLARADLVSPAAIPSYAVYLNDGAATFTDATSTTIGLIQEHGFAVAAADLSGDGKLDLYLCSRGAFSATSFIGTQDHLLLGE